MLKSLWRRFFPSSRDASDERALSRYLRDEGLHAELAALDARHAGAQHGFERALHSAHWYFAA